MPITLDTIARSLIPASAPRYALGDSPLFQALYDAYVRLTEDREDGFVRLKAEADAAGALRYRSYIEHDPSRLNDDAELRRRAEKVRAGAAAEVCGKALQELTDWYLRTYDPAGAASDRRGASRAATRNVVFAGGQYGFGRPLSRSLFEKYLLRGGTKLDGDTRDFLLHTAVAFRLAPDTLDKLLVHYGFHPLHVKNVHHMAIYAVLHDCAAGALPKDTDPFAEVKAFFLKARELVTAPGSGVGDAPFQVLSDGERAAVSGSTRVIREYIRSQPDMTRDRALAFIREHPQYYGMRHDRLLAEHRRLADLFSELYASRDTDEAAVSEGEGRYCLYRFVNDFCKRMKQKRFKDQLYGQIAKKDRHPTRELMILLWLYAFSFLTLPEVSTSTADGVGRSFRDFTPFSRYGRRDKPFNKYVDPQRPDILRILAYLTDKDEPGCPMPDFGAGTEVFSGSDLCVFINRKLSDYSWRPLDGNAPFDRLVLALGSLTVKVSGAVPQAYWDGERITGLSSGWEPNVPAPLVLIVRLLEQYRTSARSRLPLECSIYELI